MNITFWDCNLKVVKAEYKNNNRTSLHLIDKKGIQHLTATVNVPEIDLNEDEILIKNWSGNLGILECLEQAGIIKQLNEQIEVGFTHADKCKLLI